ncbi:MAG: AAA family ATPase, partial [Rhodanobacteraceae bacterium]
MNRFPDCAADIPFPALDDGSSMDDDRTEKIGYRLRDIDAPIEAEAARYALRIVSASWVQRRVFKRNRCVDDDILELLGIEQVTCHGKRRAATLLDLGAALQQQARRLALLRPRRKDQLARNIDNLGGILKLKEEERRLLKIAVVTTRVSGFADLFRVACRGPSEVCEAVGRALQLKCMAVHRALRSNRTLRSSGFFEYANFSPDMANPLEMRARICDALLAPHFEIERFLRHLVRRGVTPRLSLDDYAHIRDTELLRRYLGESVSRRRKGANVLLYGDPGTGKTEFVRALAAALKLELSEVPNEDEDGDPIDGDRRFSSYAICQKILAGRRGQLLLFDEVEDVFGHGLRWLEEIMGRQARAPGKSWTNEILETNPAPAIWVCNDIGAMDPAHLRRFDLMIEFRVPGPQIMRKVIARYFRPGEISDACVARLTTLEKLSPAQIERAARVVRALRSRDVQRRDAEVERVLGASLRAMGLKCTAGNPALPAHYDPAFVNADRDLRKLVAGLRQGSGARLCFYGPPGTGKTAFAHHLGKQLDRQVIVKRGSDLLGPYVGMTEALIADAFRRAGDENAILVIDEADGFLRDRTGANQPWEVTQVNELLTQMEAFEGIFIASTNLIDTLDAASLR